MMKYLFLACLIPAFLTATSTVQTAAHLSNAVYEEKPIQGFQPILKHHHPVFGNRLIAFYDAVNQQIYIAIRGTSKIQNWIANAHVASSIISSVHPLLEAWFIEAFHDLNDAANKTLARYPNTKFIFTGHSYGGLMAHLLAQSAYHQNPKLFFECHTFNAPGAKEIRQNTLKLPELPAKILERFSNHIRFTDIVGDFGSHEGQVFEYAAAHRSGLFAEHEMRYFAEDLE